MYSILDAYKFISTKIQYILWMVKVCFCPFLLPNLKKFCCGFSLKKSFDVKIATNLLRASASEFMILGLNYGLNFQIGSKNYEPSNAAKIWLGYTIFFNSNELEPLTHADSFLARIGTFCSKIGHNTTCCLSFAISSKNLNKNSTWHAL